MATEEITGSSSESGSPVATIGSQISLEVQTIWDGIRSQKMSEDNLSSMSIYMAQRLSSLPPSVVQDLYQPEKREEKSVNSDRIKNSSRNEILEAVRREKMEQKQRIQIGITLSTVVSRLDIAVHMMTTNLPTFSRDLDDFSRKRSRGDVSHTQFILVRSAVFALIEDILRGSKNELDEYRIRAWNLFYDVVTDIVRRAKLEKGSEKQQAKQIQTEQEEEEQETQPNIEIHALESDSSTKAKPLSSKDSSHLTLETQISVGSVSTDGSENGLSLGAKEEDELDGDDDQLSSMNNSTFDGFGSFRNVFQGFRSSFLAKSPDMSNLEVVSEVPDQ